MAIASFLIRTTPTLIPDMQVERRAQMVIDTCTALGHDNPIAMIHDVGAGGLSNALPERKSIFYALRPHAIPYGRLSYLHLY